MKILSLMVFLTILKRADLQSYYCAQCKEKYNIGCFCVNSNECQNNLKLKNILDRQDKSKNVKKEVCKCTFSMDYSTLTNIGCSVGHFEDSKINYCNCIVREIEKKIQDEPLKKTETETNTSWDSKYIYEFTAMSTWIFFAFVIICCLGKNVCCNCFNSISSSTHDNSDVRFFCFYLYYSITHFL